MTGPEPLSVLDLITSNDQDDHMTDTSALDDAAEQVPEDSMQAASAPEFAARWNAMNPKDREGMFQAMMADRDTADRCHRAHHYVDNLPEGSRPFMDLAETGLLWLINRQVFHPRGFALGIDPDPLNQIVGWRLLGDGYDTWNFDLGEGVENEALRRAEALFVEQRTGVAAAKRAADLSGMSEKDLHRNRAHPDWEYTVTTNVRKGDTIAPDGEGWEPNEDISIQEIKDGEMVIVGWRSWDRFEYHEEYHWRRLREALVQDPQEDTDHG